MNYIEVTLNTPGDELDLRCEALAAMGAEGFVIENEADFKDFLSNNHQFWDYVDSELERRYAGVSRVRFYLTDDEAGRGVLKRVQAAYSPEWKVIEDGDWGNSWRENYGIIEVGERLMIVPSWLEVPDNGRTPVIFDPGIAFGNGNHATTRMCLAALEKLSGSGSVLLDLGCGSGILGIAALALGADRVLGVDIDPKSPDAVMFNASLNGFDGERISARCGDIVTDKSLRSSLGGGYDVVLANIVADVIIRLCPYIRGFMRDGGAFVCSGIIDGREGETAAALTAAGFRIIESRHEEEWNQFTCL